MTLTTTDDGNVFISGEGLPTVDEKFLSDQGLNLSGLTDAYGTLQKHRHTLKEDLSKELSTQYAPPDEYNNPEIDLSKRDLPPEFEIDFDEPRLKHLREQGILSQSQYEQVVEASVAYEESQWQAAKARIPEVLGENAVDRIERVLGTIKTAVGEEHYPALNELARTPEAIVAMEVLLTEQGTPGGGAVPGGNNDVLTEEELEKLMDDPQRKMHSREGEKIRKKISAHYAAKHPGMAQLG